MAYLPENHFCCVCGVYLGPDDGDAICPTCDNAEEFGETGDEPDESELRREQNARMDAAPLSRIVGKPAERCGRFRI